MAKKKKATSAGKKKKATRKKTSSQKKSAKSAVKKPDQVAESSADFVVQSDPDPALTPFEVTAAKVRTFPQSPGVYLMKDAAGVVIYVGKATNLRSRAGSYFLKAASEEARTADWIPLIADADFMRMRQRSRRVAG